MLPVHSVVGPWRSGSHHGHGILEPPCSSWPPAPPGPIQPRWQGAEGPNSHRPTAAEHWGATSGGENWGAKPGPPAFGHGWSHLPGGVGSWPWVCGAGGQAGLSPASPGKTRATSCHLGPGEPPAASHCPVSCQAGASPWWPHAHHRGTQGPATPRCSMQGIPRGSARGWQSWGLLRDQGGLHQTHAGSPGGTGPPHTPPARSLPAPPRAG